MLIYPILAGLFAVGVVTNLVVQPTDWPNVWAGSGIVVLLMSMWLWLRTNVRKQREILEWLETNQHLLTDRPQYFRDSPFPMIPISSRSTLRSFRVVTSCLIVTSTSNTGSDLRSSLTRGVLASLWTLLLGWWGIPWGPLRTVQALVKNLSGGDKLPISELLLGDPEGEEDQA